ncbi:MAG TPA: efflux RND transporter periplasmic adaptor subunit [Pirellulales bacterium]|jgi:cobalt-zinc-cadmium efflux system membrane fusion protein|nr:efflux RND transporter periplasmic adaptor subunit [Pirellulales bacterium]
MAVQIKRTSGARRDIGSLISTLLTIAVAVALIWMGVNAIRKRHADPGSAGEVSVRLVKGGDGMTVSPEMVRSFGLRTTQARVSDSRAELVLFGSLFIDPTRMMRAHSRFPGEVVSIGKVTLPPAESSAAGSAQQPVEPRPLQVGDFVHKGDLLAIIWSKDVGEKKSDLVDALSQMYLDRDQLNRLKGLEKGIVEMKKIHEAEHKFETDQIAVDRIERTLRSWRLTESEIAAVRGEAEKIHRDQTNHAATVDKTWAEVDVKAPFDAKILERNATTGDIVDTDLDLFILADLTTLGVTADAYEEDLPALEAIPPSERRWKIQVKADSRRALPGTFETIGQIINPTDHTAPIIGWVSNPDNSLRAGQFITATIELPKSEEEVAIPRTAVIDEGTRSVVFVATDETGTTVSQRQVAIARPSHDVIYVRSQPTPHELSLGCQPLLPGEWVVSSGTVELASALENLVINSAAEPPK